MPLLYRLAWRELRNNRRFSFLFILNLVLGLSGFLTLHLFKESVTLGLQERSRQLLTADISVSARRPITDSELALVRGHLGPQAEETSILEMYSMAASAATSRLAEVLVVAPGYPFYGTLKLRHAGLVDGPDPKEILTQPKLWIQADLAAQLRVRLGDNVQLGEKTFTVGDFVEEDAGASARGFSLASRLFIGRDQLPGTGLVQKGSTISYRYFYKLPAGSDAAAIARELDRKLQDASLRVTSHERASQSVGRTQGFLNDYLGLAALASLFLSALGAAYLFRNFLAQRLKEIAILLSLGLPPRSARGLFLIELGLLGTAASLTAIALAAVVLPIAIRYLAAFVPIPLTTRFSLDSIAWALAVGVLGSLLTCWPLLQQLKDLSATALFQEQIPTRPGTTRWTTPLSSLPSLFLYWALAVWQAKSYVTGSLFVGLFLGSGLLLGLLAALGLSLAGRIAGRQSLWPRLAIRHIARTRLASISCFLAIGLGVLLINVIPQIQKSLEQEVRQPQVSEVPSLFLFDVQPEQEPELRQFIAAQGQSLNFLTPLIRGRLMEVNKKAFTKDPNAEEPQTREEERSARFRNRGFNLTYRASLTESERLVAGRPFSPTVGEIPEISVERRFAKRLGLKIGDVLTFDVESVPIEGKIISLRAVEWTSFQPNFFVQFQPGVLEEAPKTFLASVPSLPTDKRLALQDALVAKFPTISIIDVSQVVQRLLSIFGQMGWAIRWMGLLSLIAGFVVLFSIAHHEAYTRRQEANLLKVLGAPLGQVRHLFRLEYGLLVTAAGFAGTFLSFLMSWSLSRLLFESTWVFHWQTPLLVGVATLALALLTIDVATARVLRQSPLGLLQTEL